ncbi:outer membrane beta-barrel protein [Pontibacter oryzae]|uniref:Outer membrane protein beta-barrel domain-containing protein n=1 Tax=Pontibacter oryzae TaxID=2304593 RepID=A0A399S6N1_9BACT|nr:outer membrane beta-barrel protein [Pontibacter oryzae]RIJ37712.1 hypothetical protein D1627_11470 [Pontibacter oryzae]
MKLLFIFSFLVALTSSAMAQQPEEVSPREGNLYIGVGATNVEYHIYYKEKKGTGTVRSGYFTPMFLTVGYKWTERAKLQVSLGYGGDKQEIEGAGGTTASSRTQALALAVSGQFTFFNVLKRFPVYGSVTAMPAYGTTKSKETENGVIVSDTKDAGTDVFATAALGFNYKISKRFTGYTEYLFFKRSLTGENSYYYDWNQDATLLDRVAKSLAMGLNYNFNLKQEK